MRAASIWSESSARPEFSVTACVRIMAARRRTSTCAASPSSANLWRDSTDWRILHLRCRDSAAGRSRWRDPPRASGQVFAAGRTRRGAGGVRPVRSGSRFRCRGHAVPRTARRAITTCSTARRPGFRTAASRISTAYLPARSRRTFGPTEPRPRAASVLSRSTPARRGCRSPPASTSSRRIRWAPCGFQRLPDSGGESARRRGRGIQDRDAHPGYLSHLGGRGRARLCAARAG